jgi:hypothetical protein
LDRPTSPQVRERKLKSEHATDRANWEKEKAGLETSLSELEQSKNAALGEAEAKLVVAEQKLMSSQESLVAERAKHAMEINRLSDELAAAVAARDDAGRRAADAESDRRWLITQGFAYVFQKLRKSAEFLKPIAAVQQLVWDAGCYNGLLAGHAEAALSLKPEESAYYKPDAHDQLGVAAKALDETVFPYLESIANLGDKPLEDLQTLEPSREGPPQGEKGSSV